MYTSVWLIYVHWFIILSLDSHPNLSISVTVYISKFEEDISICQRRTQLCIQQQKFVVFLQFWSELWRFMHNRNKLFQVNHSIEFPFMLHMQATQSLSNATWETAALTSVTTWGRDIQFRMRTLYWFCDKALFPLILDGHTRKRMKSIEIRYRDR